MEKALKVGGMHCKSCEMLLSDVIGDVSGAKALLADFKKGEIKVNCDSEQTLEKVKQAIKAEGYTV